MSVSTKFKDHKVVPDVLNREPENKLQVKYDGNRAEFGNVLTPTQVQNQPTLEWNVEKGCLYTVVMVDPDAPSRRLPKYREWLHWLVVNVPGEDIDEGEVLAEYVGAGPAKMIGLHRYVILVYKQAGKITDDDVGHLTDCSGEGRGSWKLSQFVKNHHLSEPPVCGKFFQALWDEYVQKLYKQLSGA